jgi:short-subunit dehydrogenase
METSSIAMTPDKVAEIALRALATGRVHVVPGLFNKLYTFAGARLPKGISARIVAKVLGRRGPEAAKT